MHGRIVSIENGFLSDISIKDVDFIKSLFDEPDIDFFYVRQPYHREAFAFTQFMVESQERGRGLNDIIYNEQRMPVGLISAELVPSDSERVRWNIGYAVLSKYRHKGYASGALNAYIYNLQEFSINTAYLDISVDNIASEKVAKKCGFELRDCAGFIDSEHPEVGLRRHWYKSIHLQDDRIPFFQRANIAYRNKDYRLAIRIYEEALNVPVTVGSQLTDAQIYSNMGMAYSSLGCYYKAFSYLQKAVHMGLINSSIQKELFWLKSNVGLE